MIDITGTTVYNYDVRGLLLSETKGDIVKTYTYDANGNRTSFVAPSINVNTSYTYDSLGRMLTVSDEAFGTTAYTYDANSNVTRVANGTTTATMSYDAQNRLVSKFSGADTYTLTYYNDGNVKRVTDSEGTINYTYNETGALASGDGATYKYDIYGNRSEMTKDGSTYRYYYDMNNRLIREADFADNIVSAYRYDNNGNLIERTHMPETTTPTENASATLSVVSAPTFTTDTFTFDVLGRMSSATVNGTTTTYTYDGNGLRQTKNNKAFVYDGANIVWEGESLTTGTTYYRGLELIAYKPQGRTRTFYKTDWHGNIEGYDYDDFGNPTGGNTANPFRYNGEYFDVETGFIYLRARYYDPGIGRFVSEDPIRDGTNWYAYCANDPVNAVDPSGYITEEEIDMYENGEMAPMAYSYLMKLTYRWYLADTDEDRELYHQLAEEFRANDYKTTGGKVKSVDEGIAFMPEKPSGEITKEQHYFRNELNINFTWKQFTKLQERLPEHLKWNDNVAADYHQNHTVNNQPNRKYVSFDGHFELIYNDDNVLLTEYNNPDDMGTYNYANPENVLDHYKLDVAPYGVLWRKWGNVPEN